MDSVLYRKGDQFYSPGFELYSDQRTLNYSESDRHTLRHNSSDQRIERRSSADTIHWHDYCEVEFVLSGHGVHELNGRRYTLSENCVYLITPMDFHAVLVEKNCPLTLCHVQFGCSVLSAEIMQRISALTPGIAVQLNGLLADKVRAMFEEIQSEFDTRREDSPAMLRACLERLCLLILREAERGIELPGKPRTEENAAINQAIQYIQYNFRSAITLSDIARLVHLSNNYFGELFRTHLGMTFHEYLRQQRLTYASRLLMDTELSISEIARESGFQSLSYFTEIFKAAYGSTPTAFRYENHSKEENP